MLVEVEDVKVKVESDIKLGEDVMDVSAADITKDDKGDGLTDKAIVDDMMGELEAMLNPPKVDEKM